MSIAELLISSNKFNSYTPDQHKNITLSCVNDCPAGSVKAMSFCIIAYRCYKQLQLDDSGKSHHLDRFTERAIEKGREQQALQRHTLLSLFFDHGKKRGEDALSQDVWRKMTTYLPGGWLRNDNNTIRNGCSIS